LATAAARTRAVDAVVAAGGDSTIRGVAGGLVGRLKCRSHHPDRSGNVLAEELRLAGTLRPFPAICSMATSSGYHPASPTVRFFYPWRALALTLTSCTSSDMGLKSRIGKRAYVGPTWRKLWSRSRPRRFEAVVDGRAYPCTWLIVTKTAHYAGSFVIAPRQRMAEPGFHALIIDASSPTALASVIVAIGLGWAERHPLVKALACRNVVVPVGQDVGFQLDDVCRARRLRARDYRPAARDALA